MLEIRDEPRVGYQRNYHNSYFLISNLINSDTNFPASWLRHLVSVLPVRNQQSRNADASTPHSTTNPSLQKHTTAVKSAKKPITPTTSQNAGTFESAKHSEEPRCFSKPSCARSGSMPHPYDSTQCTLKTRALLTASRPLSQIHIPSRASQNRESPSTAFRQMMRCNGWGLPIPVGALVCRLFKQSYSRPAVLRRERHT